MNIKKLLAISCLTLQFSSYMYADQAAWNKAFLAFGGGSDPVAAANSIAQNSLPVTSALTAASSAGNTPEAKAVGRYVTTPASKKTMFVSNFTDADVKAAISAASGVTTPAATTTTTPVATTTTTATTTLPQLSDTTNWAAAFTAFGGVNAIANKTASSVMPSSITASSAAYGDAQVIVKYLTNSPMNSVDAANLNNAITSAQAAAATTTANANATDNAAAALKSQIDSSLVTYNSYLTSVSKAPVKIIAA